MIVALAVALVGQADYGGFTASAPTAPSEVRVDGPAGPELEAWPRGSPMPPRVRRRLEAQPRPVRPPVAETVPVADPDSAAALVPGYGRLVPVPRSGIPAGSRYVGTRNGSDFYVGDPVASTPAPRALPETRVTVGPAPMQYRVAYPAPAYYAQPAYYVPSYATPAYTPYYLGGSSSGSPCENGQCTPAAGRGLFGGLFRR